MPIWGQSGDELFCVVEDTHELVALMAWASERSSAPVVLMTDFFSELERLLPK